MFIIYIFRFSWRNRLIFMFGQQREQLRNKTPMIKRFSHLPLSLNFWGCTTQTANSCLSVWWPFFMINSDACLKMKIISNYLNINLTLNWGFGRMVNGIKKDQISTKSKSLASLENCHAYYGLYYGLIQMR